MKTYKQRIIAYARANFPKIMVFRGYVRGERVNFKCTKHHSVFSISWEEFLAQRSKPTSAHGGRRSLCPECSESMSLKFAGENNPAYKGGVASYQASIDKRFGAGVLTVTGKYTFLHKKVSLRHNECGAVKDYKAAESILRAKYPCSCARIKAIAPFHQLADKQKDFISFCYTKLLYNAAQIRDITGVPATTVVRVLKSLGVLREANELSAARKTDTLLQGSKADAWGTYLRVSNIVTRLVMRSYCDIIDPKNLRSAAFHLDHMVSRYDGFSRYSKPVDLRLICHPANLKIVSSKENLVKNKKSSLSISRLKRRIRKFESTHGVVQFPDNYEYEIVRDQSTYVSSEGLRVLALDPGTKNFGVFGGVLHGAVDMHGVKPVVTTMLKNPLTSLTADVMGATSNFMIELDFLMDLVQPDIVVIERFQTRGLMGTTVELVGFMLGLIAGHINRRNSDHNLHTVFRPIVASQWKNAVNKKADLLEIYAKLDGPHQHHRLDAFLMALYAFPNKDVYKFLTEEKVDSIASYIRSTPQLGY